MSECPSFRYVSGSERNYESKRPMANRMGQSLGGGGGQDVADLRDGFPARAKCWDTGAYTHPSLQKVMLGKRRSQKPSSLTVWLAPQATSRTTTFGTGKICPSFVFSMKMATRRGTSSQSYSIRCALAMNFPSELCPGATRASSQRQPSARAPAWPIGASPGHVCQPT